MTWCPPLLKFTFLLSRIWQHCMLRKTEISCFKCSTLIRFGGLFFLKNFKLETSVKVWNVTTFKYKPSPQDSMKTCLRMKTSLFLWVISSKNLDTSPHSCWTDNNQDYCFVKLQMFMAKGFFFTTAESFLFSFIQMKPVLLIIKAALQSAPFL